jgi:hypothetical protein
VAVHEVTPQLEFTNMPPKPTKAELAWDRWRKVQAGKARIRQVLDARRKLQDEQHGTPAVKPIGLHSGPGRHAQN